jgi:cytochrome c oxidase subunit 2
MELLILVAVLLTVIAVAKVLRAKELVDSTKDPDGEPISPAEVKTNALGMLIFGITFLSAVVWMIVAWNKYILPTAASEHGGEIDMLLNVTWALIGFVFFITHIFLFWFAYKYSHDSSRKAYWFPHDNRLEMLWTVVPAAVLILLITYGMSTWHDVMNQEEAEDAVRVEIVSEQFRWTTRYAGEDKVLGQASFALYGKNSVGIATEIAMKDRIAECEKVILNIAGKDSTGLVKDSSDTEKLLKAGWNREEELDDIKQSLKNYRANIRRINRLLADFAVNPAKYTAGADDQVINSDSIYLPKGRQVILKFRSKDVIHSAYLPHFRVQMNTVPGMTTSFTFKPIFTNEEMKIVATEEGKQFTGYILLCNKICGTSHYNMKLHVRVVEPEAYANWIAGQTKFAEAFKQ